MKHDHSAPQRNLYVLNLPLDVSTDHFEDLFKQQGQVAHAVILATLDSLARRRGFILMSSNREASMAIKHLDGYVWHGYRIEVSYAIVQRSGAPIPHTASTGSDTEDKRLSQPEPDQPSPVPPSENPVPTAQQSASLLLSNIDLTVVSSEMFLRALTQPFGHLHSVHLSLERNSFGIGTGRVRFCCNQSAFIAKQSLHGLHIGRHSLDVESLPSQVEDARTRDNSDDPAESQVRKADVAALRRTHGPDSSAFQPHQKHSSRSLQDSGEESGLDTVELGDSMIVPHRLPPRAALRPIGDERYKDKAESSVGLSG